MSARKYTHRQLSSARSWPRPSHAWPWLTTSSTTSIRFQPFYVKFVEPTTEILPSQSTIWSSTFHEGRYQGSHGGCGRINLATAFQYSISATGSETPTHDLVARSCATAAWCTGTCCRKSTTISTSALAATKRFPNDAVYMATIPPIDEYVGLV